MFVQQVHHNHYQHPPPFSTMCSVSDVLPRGPPPALQPLLLLPLLLFVEESFSFFYSSREKERRRVCSVLGLETTAGGVEE